MKEGGGEKIPACCTATPGPHMLAVHSKHVGARA